MRSPQFYGAFIPTQRPETFAEERNTFGGAEEAPF
jgi:hypothetical protein